MNTNALWNHIESRLESQLPSWRTRADELRQLDAVEDRAAGRTWSDDEVFEWMGEENTAEQRETIEYLLHALDEDRLSDRKLFPEDLKDESW